jgi:hypothetical protein
MRNGIIPSATARCGIENMSDVLFIFGAGTSKDCGGPLMNEFLDVARNLYLTNRAGDKAPEFKLVFEVIGHLQQPTFRTSRADYL